MLRASIQPGQRSKRAIAEPFELRGPARVVLDDDDRLGRECYRVISISARSSSRSAGRREPPFNA